MKNFISSIENHLKKLNPKIHDVNIKVVRDQDGFFVSKIHVRAKKKILHAMKRDTNPKKSLDRSFQAIVGQMQRMKDRMLGHRQRTRRWAMLDP